MEKIYEVIINIRCLEFEFIRSEWKVFTSEDEARGYGLKVQDELNDGLSPEEKAGDGYYFQYWFCRPVEEIDGFPVSVGKLTNLSDRSLGRGGGTGCHSGDGCVPHPEKPRG
ncbi:MAG: hypothetical protein Q8Q12_05195 [bacterium]|nr:hypothetical protein [bacterium]